MIIKKFGRDIKKRIRKFLGIHDRQTSEEFCKWLREMGCTIGERVIFFDPQTTVVDVTRPWMIEIGNDVQIPFGVSILTHGYDWAVLKGKYGDILGSAGKVKIGNNVFIGVNSTILKGVTIGNNVIIGACSLVTHDIPDNVVACGNPCRVIMSLSDYYEKRQKSQIDEASSIVKEYRKHYGRDPSDDELSEFFWIFTRENRLDIESYQKQMHNVGNYEESCKRLLEHEPDYESKEDFLKSVK